MTNQELRRQWEAKVAEFHNSVLSTKQWAETNNVKLSQLRYWIRKLKSPDNIKNQSPKWFSVDIGDGAETTTSSSLSVKVGKATIEVKPGFNPSLLKEVVRTLEAL
jgi:hypothetical protein